jgi:hypothetical protein
VSKVNNKDTTRKDNLRIRNNNTLSLKENLKERGKKNRIEDRR